MINSTLAVDLSIQKLEKYTGTIFVKIKVDQTIDTQKYFNVNDTSGLDAVV